jgi:hypothetical protein
MDFNKLESFSDKAIRNKQAEDEVELSFQEMEADKAVDALLRKYHGEPEFQRRIAIRLADRILGR